MKKVKIDKITYQDEDGVVIIRTIKAPIFFVDNFPNHKTWPLTNNELGKMLIDERLFFSGRYREVRIN